MMSLCFINGMQLLIFSQDGGRNAVGYRPRRFFFFPFGLRQEYGMSIWTARRGAMLRAAYQNGAAHLCFSFFF